MKADAKAGVMWPQAKENLETLEAARHKGLILP